MALGTNNYTAADLAVFIPEEWGTKVNDFFREALEVTQHFTDRSDEVAMGGDTLYTPGTTAFTTTTKAAGAQVTLQSPTEATKTLTISTHKETSFLIEDKELAQLAKSYTLKERRMQDAAYAVAEDLEVAITALFAGFSSAVGSTTVALTETVCREAISTLRTAIKSAFKNNQVKFFLHPKTVWEDLMASDKFVNMDYKQSGTGKTAEPVPYIYGIEVVQTTNLATANSAADYVGALAHKDAIHYAMSPLPGMNSNGVRLQSDYILEYLGELVVADILYGVLENRDDAGVGILSAV